MRQGRFEKWTPLLLVLIVVGVYAPLLAHGFVIFDDDGTIFENARFNPPSWGAIGYYWLHEHMSLWIPVTHSAWGLLALLTYVPTPDEMGVHLDARIYHGASILVHAWAVVAAYALLRNLLTGDGHALPPERKPDDPAPTLCWSAAAGALLFGLHPLAVESVAWASGLKDLLYTALSLSAILLYMKAARRSGGNASLLRSRDYWLATLSFALALLSKPTAVVTPLLAAMLDWVLLARPWRKVAAGMLPWLALVVPVIIIGKIVQPGVGVWRPPLWQRPLVAGASLAFYLWKLIWPLKLAPDYGLRPRDILTGDWRWAGAAVVIAIVALGAVIPVQRKRAAEAATRRPSIILLPLAGVLFFILAPLPTLGFVRFQFQYFSTVSDHYTQLALFGASMMLAWIAHTTWRWASARVAIAALLGAWVVLNVRQQHSWRDSAALYEHELAVNPNSYLARSNLGSLYQRIGQPTAAEREYRQALALDPEMMTPRVNLTSIMAGEGRLGEAMEMIDQTQRVNARRDAEARADVSNAYGVVGRNLLAAGHPAWAIPFLEEQLRTARTADDADIRAALEQARSAVAATRPAGAAASRPAAPATSTTPAPARSPPPG
jgi:tetratricopeptide (TPR) repeat protein